MKNSLLLISFIIAIFLSIGFTYQTQSTQTNTPTVTNTIKPVPTNTPVITLTQPLTATIQATNTVKPVPTNTPVITLTQPLTATVQATNTVKPIPTNTSLITVTATTTTAIQSQTSQTSNTDWSTIITIGVAVLSLLLSIVTLILTNLRGPDINLALPDEIYPCQGIGRGPANGFIGKMPFILKTNLLIANTGMRSGVLYYFRIDPLDDDLDTKGYHFSPSYEETLPKTIPAGEGWQTTLFIPISFHGEPQLHDDYENSLREILQSKAHLKMQIVYWVDKTWFWQAILQKKIEKRAVLNIDLKSFRKHIQD